MAKQIPASAIRLPPPLREQLKAIARANNRSLNAEMVARLQASVSGDDHRPVGAVNALPGAAEPSADYLVEVTTGTGLRLNARQQQALAVLLAEERNQPRRGRG
jgi:hypothetical protein